MNLQLSKNSINKIIHALEFMHELFNSNIYEDLIRFLINKHQNGSRIWISGVGKNSHIATKISETMTSLGIRSGYLNSSHTPHGDFGFLDVNDVVIYISRSGKTSEVLYNIDYINKNYSSVGQILIHCNNNLQINLKLDYNITLENVVEADEFELAPTTSTTSILAFLDAISIELSKNLGFTKKQFFLSHPGGSLGEKLKDELK